MPRPSMRRTVTLDVGRVPQVINRPELVHMLKERFGSWKLLAVQFLPGLKAQLTFDSEEARVMIERNTEIDLGGHPCRVVWGVVGQARFGTGGSRLNAIFVRGVTFRACALCVGNVGFAKRRGILPEIVLIVIVMIGGRPPLVVPPLRMLGRVPLLRPTPPLPVVLVLT